MVIMLLLMGMLVVHNMTIASVSIILMMRMMFDVTRIVIMILNVVIIMTMVGVVLDIAMNCRY